MSTNNTEQGTVDSSSGTHQRVSRRAMLKTAAVGVGVSAVPIWSAATSVRGQSAEQPMHTLTISANGPVDYEFTVDGTLEADTEFGDFSADTTGPRPADAGGQI